MLLMRTPSSPVSRRRLLAVLACIFGLIVLTVVFVYILLADVSPRVISLQSGVTRSEQSISSLACLALAAELRVEPVDLTVLDAQYRRVGGSSSQFDYPEDLKYASFLVIEEISRKRYHVTLTTVRENTFAVQTSVAK